MKKKVPKYKANTFPRFDPNLKVFGKRIFKKNYFKNNAVRIPSR